MSTLSLRLPDSLHRKIRELAEREDISINQYIATAVAEKTSALLTVAYLEDRAKNADPDLFGRLLRRVPDVPPLPGDEPHDTKDKIEADSHQVVQYPPSQLPWVLSSQ
ncbi:MAG TPA: toxin-antitoxin system HicB family antitoxin [Candidatus Tectomicrobia bacterium]